MFIPTFSDVKFVKQDGFLTSEMQMFLDQLIQALQGALSDNGWTAPEISDTNLVAIEPDMPNGTFWYEETNNVVVFKINGALRKVDTSVYP